MIQLRIKILNNIFIFHFEIDFNFKKAKTLR